MKKENHIYFYSAGAILFAIGAYFVISKNKNKSNNTGIQEENVSKDLVTDTGSIITNEQALIPIDLKNIFSIPVGEASKLISGAKFYTKVDEVNARKTANVNNGILNNIWGTVGKKDTFLGKVTAIATDKNNAKNIDGKIYRWVKFSLPPNTLKGQTNVIPAYFREDTIKLI